MRDKPFTHIKLRILLSAFIALILLFILFSGSLNKNLSEGVFGFLSPIFHLGENVKGFFNNIMMMLADKQRLGEENEYLREIVFNLKGNLEDMEIIKKDNDRLREMLGRTPENKIMANIILRPPETLYDVFLVDAGEDNGVEVGMKVITPGGIFLGNVSEVYKKTSKVTEVSYFGKETNVFFEDLGIPAIALGIGADTMQIQLPRAIEGVASGERILTIGGVPHLVGFTEQIETKNTDSMQTILMRIPLNINHIRSVLII